MQKGNPWADMPLFFKVIIGFAFVAVLIAFANLDSQPDVPVNKEPPTTRVPWPNIGEPLQTQMFEVTVLGAESTDAIELGNQFLDKYPDKGSYFYLLNVRYKNTDAESRMVYNGELLIDYNGKRYKFDNTEPVAYEGFGFSLESINPLSSKQAIIVYQIPYEMHGRAFYHPSRAAENELIDLGYISRK
jgi:hypothetical protein